MNMPVSTVDMDNQEDNEGNTKMCIATINAIRVITLMFYCY